MRFHTDNIMRGISVRLISNAKAALEFKKIVTEQKMRDKNTGKIDYDDCLTFFLENHISDLTLYKLKRNSGYKLIVLYKGVEMVGSAEFVSSFGKDLQKKLILSEKWDTYQLLALKKRVLSNIFSNPYDKRTGDTFKPTADKVWEIIEAFL